LKGLLLGLLSLPLLLCGVANADVEVSKNLTVTGILQYRYNATQDVKKNWQSGAFDVRRAELGFIVKPSPKLSVKLQADFATGAAVAKDLWARYLVMPNVGVTFGQMVVPFGLENQISDGDMLTLERATVAGNLFPGRRDRGFKVDVNGKAGELVVGAFNGDGPNVKAVGNDKEGVVRVLVPLGEFVKVGASGLYGNDRFGTRNAFGGDLQVDLGLLNLSGEYVRAHEAGHTPEGFITQGVLFITPADQVVAKFDRFSPDTSRDRMGVVDTYNLGVVHTVSQNMNLKLFFVNSKSERRGNSNGVTAEVMVRF
jgi:phosphate-selective porin